MKNVYGSTVCCTNICSFKLKSMKNVYGSTVCCSYICSFKLKSMKNVYSSTVCCSNICSFKLKSMKNMYGNHWEKIGQHFPSICYILHLTYFKFNQQISPTLQTNIRSIFSNSPMGMGPSSLELPNQLILHTGHRNAEAKTAPWTPNATQRLQVDLLLRLANSTSLLPTWHGAQPRRTRKPEMVHLIMPPSSIHKTVAKSVKRPRTWHNTARG